MILHLALLLALTASAAPDKPIILKTLHSFPWTKGSFVGGVVDPGFTVIATPTDSSVNLWSLESGQQIGRFDLPRVESTNEKDVNDVQIHSVRPDLKLMLVSLRHLYFDPKRKDGDDAPTMSRAIQTIYLASLDDEKNLKKLWSFDGPCAIGRGLSSFACPGFGQKAYWASISDDLPFINIEGDKYYSGHLTGPLYKGDVRVIFGLNGKKLFENEVVKQDYKIVKGTEKSFDSPLLNTAVYLAQDEQSCSAMRNEKRVSFLHDCSVEDNPVVLTGDNLVSSRYKAVYKLWDVATGRLMAKLDPQVPEGWTHDRWSEGAEARFVAVMLKKGGERQIQIWSTESGKRLATGSGPEFTDIDSFSLSPDGRRAHVVRTHYGADNWPDYAYSTFVDLGLDDSPSAPAAAPAIAKIDVDELPSGASARNPDAYAVVIGVEKYRQAGVPAVDYASRDAKTMAAYLGTMGFDPKNVAVLTDAQAGKVDFDKHFGKWLKNRVGPKSRVFVYYAGHGAPNPTTGAGYLMPYEADPSYLEETAYPVAQLYAELAKLPTKDVTVVLDACFSGQGERSLIAKGTRPMVVLQKTRGPENAAVIAAASGSQISASDHEARHGLLTYHLLAGLHGGADEDKDGRITTSELFSYARPAVERAAKLQNVEQTPTVSGDTGAAGARVWTTLKKP